MRCDLEGYILQAELDVIGEAVWAAGRCDNLRFFDGPDPLEQERQRRRQLVYLARYGRMAPSEWWDEDVEEMSWFHRELSNLVGEENELLKKKD